MPCGWPTYWHVGPVHSLRQHEASEIGDDGGVVLSRIFHRLPISGRGGGWPSS